MIDRTSDSSPDDDNSIKDDAKVYDSNASNVMSKFLKKVRRNHEETLVSQDQKQYKMKYLKREAKKVK